MDSKDLANRYHAIKEEVFNLCKGKNVPTIIAVSKNQSLENIIALARLGHRDFGENYVQELMTKKQALAQVGVLNLRFHFIGQLQRNKVKSLLPMVVSVHALDSLKLADEIQKNILESGSSKMQVWIQVNIDEEESKSGFLPNDLAGAVSELLLRDQLLVSGWMCIPNPDLNPINSFDKMHKIAQLFPEIPQKFSMGMSADYRQAVQVGTDALRLGTALFGSRT